MVAANLSLLAALTKPAAENTVKTQAETDASLTAGRDFAKLVKESSSKQLRDHHGTPRSRSESARAEFSQKTRAEWKHADREITPRQASRMLKSIDERASHATDIDPKTVAVVKEKLQAIVDSKQPAKLSDVFAAATGKDAKELDALFANASAENAAELSAMGAKLQSVVNLMKKALGSDKGESEEAIQADACGNECDVIFADMSRHPQQPVLVQEAAAVAPAPAITSILVPQVNVDNEVVTAAPVDSVLAVDSDSKRLTAETLIPSLALTADEKKKALPDVELPKADFAAAVSDNVQAALNAEPQQAPAPLPSNLERQLQALNDNRQFFANGLAKDENAPKVNATANNAQLTANIQPVGAAGTITGASAVTAIGNTAGGLLNHATVREQVHVAISKASNEGIEQITIALEPQGLGRVEVKMHTGRDGQTQLSFLVDKPETFDALSRDARGLERALQDSGLKADSGGMQFNLRQHSQQADSGDRKPQPHASLGASAEVGASAAVETRSYRVAVRDGIDIHA